MTINNNKVRVLDASMAAGKTTYLANMINESEDSARWLVITPYLTEVSRLKEICSDRCFEEPEDIDTPTKLVSLKLMLARGQNIVATHSLFLRLDKEAISIIERMGYHLVIDEQIPVCMNQKVTKKEIDALIRREVLKVGGPLKQGYDVLKLEAGPEDGLGKYEEFRRPAEADRLYLMHGNVVLWLLPVDLLQIFESVTIATYLFLGTPMNAFFDIFDIDFEHKTLWIDPTTGERELVPYDFKTASATILQHIDKVEVYDGPYNKVGEGRVTKLSKGSLVNNKRLQTDLRKSLYNFFRHHCKDDPGSLNMWTCHKAVKDKLKGDGYARQFIPLNQKATNDYANRKNIGYGLNLYMNVPEMNFFKYISHDGQGIDPDAWSLSELIQFVWRSRIRKGESIRVFLPSRRMRELFLRWMEDVKDTSDMALQKAA